MRSERCSGRGHMGWGQSACGVAQGTFTNANGEKYVGNFENSTYHGQVGWRAAGAAAGGGVLGGVSL